MNFIIKDIQWERSKLHLFFNCDISCYDIYLTSSDKSQRFSILSKNSNEAILAVTNINGTMLSNGKWYLFVNNSCVIVDIKLLSQFDSFTRSFWYTDDNYCYTVDFDITEEQIFLIKCNFMMQNRRPRKRRYWLESLSLRDFLEKISVKTFKALLSVIYRLTDFLLAHKGNKILFLSQNDSVISGNLSILHDYLKNEAANAYDLYTFTENIYKNKWNMSYWLRLIRAFSGKDFIFVDDYVPALSFLHLNKKTKLIQLWHAGAGFKAVGYARFGLKGSPHPYVSGHRKYDYVIVDDEKLVPVYEEVFGIAKDKILALGMPRTDYYMKYENMQTIVSKLYSAHKSFQHKKIILFAPTYRGEGHEDASYDFSLIDQEKLADFCALNGFICVFKFHPFIEGKFMIEKKYADLLCDVSEEYDVNELLYLADILVTDYSSVVYEYSFFRSPVIYYRYDKAFFEFQRKTYEADVFNLNSVECLSFDCMLNALEMYKNIKKVDIHSLESVSIERNSCRRIADVIL